MQARYYDPSIGRFYSNDPVGTIGHLNSGNGIQGFNRYAYANNNPYKYVDPDGHAALNPVTGAVAGGAVAGPPGAIVGGLIGAAGLIWAGNEMAEAFEEIDQMNQSSENSSDDRPEKVPKKGVKGKQGAKDVPSWAKGSRPKVGESGKEFADRLLEEQYGDDHQEPTGLGSEHNKIKKWGDRAFEDPPETKQEYKKN